MGAVAALAGASPAAAATASVGSKVYGKGAGTVITLAYSAATGERNVLEARWLGGQGGFRLRDVVPVAPGSGLPPRRPE